MINDRPQPPPVAVVLEAARAKAALLARTDAEIAAGTPKECGAWWNDVGIGGKASPDRVYCDGREHCRFTDPDWRQAVFVCDCPVEVAAARRRRIDGATRDLGGIVLHLDRAGGHGFDGYDPQRHPQARAALEVMQGYAAGRPPASGVLLSGSTGLGKTRLLIASHLELIGAGVRSIYVTSATLRTLFRKATNFDVETSEKAEQALERIARAEACHVDDLGDVAGDARAPGQFAEGLKALLDTAAAPWAVATNCTATMLNSHPDIGSKNLSRLVEQATILKLDGDDQRVRSAKRGSP